MEDWDKRCDNYYITDGPKFHGGCENPE